MQTKQQEIIKYLKAILLDVEMSAVAGLSLEPDTMFAEIGSTFSEVKEFVDGLDEVEVIQVGNQVVQQIPGTDIYKVYRLKTGSKGFYMMGTKEGCVREAQAVDSGKTVRPLVTADSETPSIVQKLSTLSKPKRRRKGGLVMGSKL